MEYEIDRALADADVVMALRLQAERQQAGLLPSLREYVVLYQINAARLRRAAPNALVMHPGPMNEGIEIAADVAHGPRSLIEEQVTNGVAVRMAALYLLAGADLTPQPPSLKGRESQGLLSPGALGEGPGGRAAHEPAVGS